MSPYDTTLCIILDIGEKVHWLAVYADFDLQPAVQPKVACELC